MTGITAAAVTVTAEARIIEVGGARLTFGMLEQLDAAGWDEITPIGRVRPPGTDPAYTETVGASARAGTAAPSPGRCCPCPSWPPRSPTATRRPARTPPRGATTCSGSTPTNATSLSPRAGIGPRCR